MLQRVKKLSARIMWFWLGILLGYVVYFRNASGDWSRSFHLGYYAPTISMMAIISGQIDLLGSIYEGKTINIRARGLDFIHWLLWMFMYIGSWMVGGVTPLWFILQVFLLMIVGWQVGIGIKRRWRPSNNEKLVGAITASIAACLGLVAGYVRTRDTSAFGWGWTLETSTSVVATLLVLWFIIEDVLVMRKKVEYPRSLFLKGILCNTLIVWFWIHQIMQGGGFNRETLKRFAGITFNIVVGGVFYLGYYATFEYYKAKQRRLTATVQP